MSQGLARVGLRQISWPAADVKPKRFLEEEEKKEKKKSLKLKLSSYLPDKMKLNELCLAAWEGSEFLHLHPLGTSSNNFVPGVTFFYYMQKKDLNVINSQNTHRRVFPLRPHF